MKTNWKKIRYKDVDWLELEVTFSHVIIRSFFEGGRSWFENICTHKEFLDGKLQLGIKMDFGEDILDEVILSVKEAPNYPVFQKEKEKKLIRKFFLEQIPIDDSLNGILTLKGTEDGNSSLAQIEDGNILSKSDNVMVVLDLDGPFLENVNGERFPLKLEGYFQAIVELHDFFISFIRTILQLYLQKEK